MAGPDSGTFLVRIQCGSHSVSRTNESHEKIRDDNSNDEPDKRFVLA